MPHVSRKPDPLRIREKTKICDDVIIGMGGVVVSNIIESGIYVGVPVKNTWIA